MINHKKAVMNVIMNTAMAIAMSLTADLMHGGLSARTWLMILLGFVVGMILSLLIPYDRMSRGLCRLLKVETRKLLSHLVATLPPAVIQTVMISAVMTAVNVLPYSPSWNVYLTAYGQTTPTMILVAYVVALAVTPIAVRLIFGKHSRTDQN